MLPVAGSSAARAFARTSSSQKPTLLDLAALPWPALQMHAPLYSSDGAVVGALQRVDLPLVKELDEFHYVLYTGTRRFQLNHWRSAAWMDGWMLHNAGRLVGWRWTLTALPQSSHTCLALPVRPIPPRPSQTATSSSAAARSCRTGRRCPRCSALGELHAWQGSAAVRAGVLAAALDIAPPAVLLPAPPRPARCSYEAGATFPYGDSVALWNLPAMRRSSGEFVDWILAQRNGLYWPGYGPLTQGAFNAFYERDLRSGPAHKARCPAAGGGAVHRRLQPAARPLGLPELADQQAPPHALHRLQPMSATLYGGQQPQAAISHMHG